MDKDKKIEELEQAIKSSDELIKSTEDLNKRYKASIDEKAKEIERLKKLAADFLPMTTLADYKEKVTLLTEQAEDMFGLYIKDENLAQWVERISGLERPNLIVYGGGDDIKDWCREKGLLWVHEYMNNRMREKGK